MRMFAQMLLKLLTTELVYIKQLCLPNDKGSTAQIIGDCECICASQTSDLLQSRCGSSFIQLQVNLAGFDMKPSHYHMPVLVLT